MLLFIDDATIKYVRFLNGLGFLVGVGGLVKERIGSFQKT